MFVESCTDYFFKYNATNEFISGLKQKYRTALQVDGNVLRRRKRPARNALEANFGDVHLFVANRNKYCRYREMCVISYLRVS